MTRQKFEVPATGVAVGRDSVTFGELRRKRISVSGKGIDNQDLLFMQAWTAIGKPYGIIVGLRVSGFVSDGNMSYCFVDPVEDEDVRKFCEEVLKDLLEGPLNWTF